MSKIDAFILKHVWWVVLALAAVLLALHSVKSEKITVDNTSIVLLIVILLSPFGSAIKKIKFGGLEAEIDSKEVNKVASEAEESVAKAPARTEAPAPRPEVVEAIRKFAETDVVIALAKLRIERETCLRRIHQRSGQQSSPRSSTVLQMVKDLQVAKILPGQMGLAIRDVMSLCNRAIHGEEIREVDAQRIIEAGI